MLPKSHNEVNSGPSSGFLQAPKAHFTGISLSLSMRCSANGPNPAGNRPVTGLLLANNNVHCNL